MMKFCQHCKKQNTPEAQFCRFCASPLSATVGSAQANFQQQQWNHGFQNNFAQPSAGASGRAIASLLLTICSLLFCCLLTSIPGAILGWMEISSIKQGRSSPAGMAMAQIGLWGGVIISVLTLFFYGFYTLLALSGGAMYY